MCIAARNQRPSHRGMDPNFVKKFGMDLLKCIFVYLHMLFDFLVDLFFGLYYRKSERVPPVTNELLLLSSVELAEKIRKRKVCAEEVVLAFVERCKEVNGIINAVVEDRYEEAIEEARAVDSMLKGIGDTQVMEMTKPFLGVPFTTKESNVAKGMLHTMGLVCRREHRSQTDATVVRFLKESGGILIAKTNIPELNLWCESRNNLYGQTNNPYDTTRTVGGSSGGEGALMASCGTPICIGSDIGGSTRMPAFFNGVFGHKPTEGLTPIKGIGLRQEDYPNTMAEAGPITKRAKDLKPLLKVLLGSKVSLLTLDTQVDLKELNILYQTESGDLRASAMSASMRRALSMAVGHFQGITGFANKVRIPGSQYSYRLWRYWMSQEEADFKLDITNGRYRANATVELSKLVSGKSDLTLAAILKLIDEDLLPKENPEWARAVTATMKKYLVEKLDKNGVLFYPSSPFSASYHYATYLRPFNFGYWCLFNVLRLPVCQVPLGLDQHGLPIGVQVVAGPYNDHLCLAVAEELERKFGGWVMPS